MRFFEDKAILQLTNNLDEHVKKLADRVIKLEYGLKKLCPHKVLSLASVETYAYGRGTYWVDGFQCDICGKQFIKNPKGSKVRIVVEKLV